MPHIVKAREKATLIKPKTLPGFTDQAFINLMDKMRSANGNRMTLFNIIEDVIDKTITEGWVSNPFFDQFVDIKEVPYGRYNSDANS